MSLRMDDANKGTIREPYEPPTVEDVPVRAEEQLLAGCKTGTSPGSDPLFCFNCMAPAAS
jgi:hypothetical protein